MVIRVFPGGVSMTVCGPRLVTVFSADLVDGLGVDEPGGARIDPATSSPSGTRRTPTTPSTPTSRSFSNRPELPATALEGPRRTILDVGCEGLLEKLSRPRTMSLDNATRRLLS